MGLVKTGLRAVIETNRTFLYVIELTGSEVDDDDNAGPEATDNGSASSSLNDSPSVGTRPRRAASGAVAMWRRKIASGQL